jgi:hypothetical protein
MGLLAWIYKANGMDCSNGGISETADRVVIVNAEGPFKPGDALPAVMLVVGPGGGGHVIAVPAVPSHAVGWREEERGCRMFGGSYVAASDSRFSDLVRRLGGQPYTAIGLHDRFER